MNTHTWTCPDCDIAWCPGCGNHGILKLVGETLAELQLDPQQTVFVSGIGQAAKLPQYVNAHHFNGLHGRALPAAQVLKLTNPELTVLVESGDGCTYGEGGNHFLAATRRHRPSAAYRLQHSDKPRSQQRRRPSAKVDSLYFMALQRGGFHCLHQCRGVRLPQG